MSEAEGAPQFLLHQVLAAPLAALVRAESISAVAYLDVISTIGFEGPEEGGGPVLGLGNLRMLSFDYQRQTPTGTIIPMIMQIPILSLIPLPLVVAKESAFTFNVALAAIRPGGPNAEQPSTPVTEAVGNLPEVELVVALPPSAPAQGQVGNASLMNVQMTIVRAELPGGVLNLLQLINADTIVQG